MMPFRRRFEDYRGLSASFGDRAFCPISIILKRLAEKYNLLAQNKDIKSDLKGKFPQTSRNPRAGWRIYLFQINVLDVLVAVIGVGFGSQVAGKLIEIHQIVQGKQWWVQ